MGGTPSKSTASSIQVSQPPPPPQTTMPAQSDSSLSGQEIAGITITSLAGVLLLASIGLYTKRNLKRG